MEEIDKVADECEALATENLQLRKKVAEEFARAERVIRERDRLKDQLGDPDAYRSGRVQLEARRWKEAWAQAKVDGDRAVREAWKGARDCKEHGSVIKEMGHRVNVSERASTRHYEATRALLSDLFLLSDELRATRRPVSDQVVDNVIGAIERAVARHQKVLNRPSRSER